MKYYFFVLVVISSLGCTNSDNISNSSWQTTEGSRPRKGAVVVTPEPYKSDSAYGRIIKRPNAAYFVELNEVWHFVIPGKICRGVSASEKLIIEKKLAEIDLMLDIQMRRLLSSRDKTLGEDEMKVVRRMLEILSIPQDVQEYLYQEKNIPLEPERVPSNPEEEREKAVRLA